MERCPNIDENGHLSWSSKMLWKDFQLILFCPELFSEFSYIPNYKSEAHLILQIAKLFLSS